MLAPVQCQSATCHACVYSWRFCAIKLRNGWNGQNSLTLMRGDAAWRGMSLPGQAVAAAVCSPRRLLGLKAAWLWQATKKPLIAQGLSCVVWRRGRDSEINRITLCFPGTFQYFYTRRRELLCRTNFLIVVDVSTLCKSIL